MCYYRSKRSTRRRSRTSASGFDTTRAPAPTTCTRSTVRRPAQTPSSRCTRTWPPDIVLVSDQSRYAHFRRSSRNSDNLNANLHLDHQGHRGREDRRHPPSVHQAAPPEGPVLPATSPCAQGFDQEDLLRHQAINFLLSVISSRCWWGLDIIEDRWTMGRPSVVNHIM